MSLPLPTEPQAARRVLMVRPAHFGPNPDTAESNRFQSRDAELPPAQIQALALREFDALAQALAGAGVDVCVMEDTPLPHKPDAIFPNNWVSFHADGTVVLYPMLAANRRLERRLDILDQLRQELGLRISRTVDLSAHELVGEYLEGTGSLVLDRPRHLAYASLSPRTDLDVLGDFAQQLDYELLSFEASDAAGVPIYHTNVLMCVGEKFAVLCGEAIRDAGRRSAIMQILESSGHELIGISLRQMRAFAGNLLELENQSGEKLIALSASALEAFEPAQRACLARHGRIIAAPIPTIERYGGGSVRCMLAELHLPRRF